MKGHKLQTLEAIKDEYISKYLNKDLWSYYVE